MSISVEYKVLWRRTAENACVLTLSGKLLIRNKAPGYPHQA